MVLALKNLPVEDRPRERLLNYGAATLSTLELLEIILSQGIAGQSVVSTSQELIKTFSNLDKLSQASPRELMQVKGIGIAKATQLNAILELAQRLKLEVADVPDKKADGPEMIYKLIKRKLRDYHKEHFFVVALNVSGMVIEQIAVGILDAALVHPREVFGEAIKHHASAIIVVHNHPSGNPNPSLPDRMLTERLKEAGQIMGIALRDHIIITQNSFLSFKDEGFL